MVHGQHQEPEQDGLLKMNGGDYLVVAGVALGTFVAVKIVRRISDAVFDVIYGPDKN